MKKRHAWILILAFTAILMIVTYSFAFGTSIAKVTLKVVDEDGNPIQNAKVGVGFRIYTQGGWGSKEKGVDGVTDKQGIFSTSALADDYVGFYANRDGYYESEGHYKFKERSLGRWEPWNPELKVVLRKIINPVPMYARDTKKSGLKIPVSNKAIGFDLIEFDWLSPYGKGKYADFYFKLSGTFVSKSEYNMQLVLSFKEKYDGIQVVEEDRSSGSVLKLPRFAYETGYNKERMLYWKEGPKQKTETNFVRNNNNYIFRVRSEEKDGKFYRAMYGKILGDIEFYPESKNSADIVLKYCLNPDYTRNLEYGGNLFKNLPDFERVGIQ